MSITAANAVVMLAIPGLYDVPQQLFGFSADDIYTADNVTVGEVQMGVDGRQAGGYVFNPMPQTFSFLADSSSNDIFEQWVKAEKNVVDKYPAFANVVLPSIGRKFSQINGILISVPMVPSAGRVLQPRRYTISWESVDGSLI